jgi:Ni/Co efflux regulator RcnB
MFKKLMLGVAAASVLAVPATAAPFDHNGNNFGNHNGRGQVERVVKTRQVATFRQQSPRFRVGQRFDRRHASNYRVIQNPRAYRLRDAPRGYRWVQSGNDAVLVAMASGLIGALFANAF